jgi:hypothetical protein
MIMNLVSEKFFKWLYKCYLSAIVLMFSGLVLLLSSCTEEVIDGPNKPGSGKMVKVNFTLGELKNKDNEVVTRKGASPASPPAPLQKRGEESPFEGEAETVVVPIGNGLSMVATLEEDQGITTRSYSPVPPGTIVRIVAYRNGTINEGYKDYTVDNDNVLTLEGEPLSIPEGDYAFVAYTFMNNSAVLKTMPHSQDLMDINVQEDLVWGIYPNDGKLEFVGENTDNNIHLKMYHQFSGVNATMVSREILIDNTIIPKITHIENVSISGRKAHMSMKDGTFHGNSQSTSYAFDDGLFTMLGTDSIISNTILVHTHGATSTILKIDSLVLDGNIGVRNLAAAFEKKLEGGFIYSLKVKFQHDQGIEHDDDPQSNLLMYVGAFWKTNQTGERLIRIQRPTIGENLAFADGDWTATVIVGGEWIVLDTETSKDQNIWTNNPTSSGNDTGFDVTYAVHSTSRKVTGTMSVGNPQIYFRIGLTSPYVATSEAPARYGVVLLTYKNNTLKHRIWIRQGDEADYLICNGAPVCTDPSHGSAYLGGPRTVTKRFSPYNLTAVNLDQEVITQAAASNPDAPGNRSRFTDYPSQAGAFFQWAQFAGRQRWAWNPHETNIPTSPDKSWWVNAPWGFWVGLWDTHNPLGAANETCPPGYRRPNDGYTDRPEDGNHLDLSEIRQSLFKKKKKGENYANDPTNGVYGLYADGFFDRRSITLSFKTIPLGGGFTMDVPLAMVAADSRHIAYSGRLFYNAFTDKIHANASLFFPDAGTRYCGENNINAGKLTHADWHQSGYWTSSAQGNSTGDGQNGIALVVRNGAYSSPWYVEKATGNMIRCVKKGDDEL